MAGWLVSVDATRKVLLKVCVSGSYARQRGSSLPWGTPESIVFGAIETHIFVRHDLMPSGIVHSNESTAEQGQHAEAPGAPPRRCTCPVAWPAAFRILTKMVCNSSGT